MKWITFLLSLLFSYASMSAQVHDSNKSLIKTLDPKECPNIKIDIRNQNLSTAIWDEGTIRLQLDVQANVPLAVLQQLVKAGRYSLDGGKDGETYIVVAPNLEKSIRIGGKDLEEIIQIKVQTPGYFVMHDNILSKDIDESTIAARSNNAEEAAALLRKMKAIKQNVVLHTTIRSSSSYKESIDLSSFKLLIDGVEVRADQITFDVPVPD